MGYNIEISLNRLKAINGSELQQNMCELANEFNCNRYYTFDDIGIFLKVKRIHTIMVINFLESELENCIKFIRHIKKNKHWCIECIYDDEISKLIHASSYYLKTIDKQKSIDYKECVKNSNFNINEMQLLNIFH